MNPTISLGTGAAVTECPATERNHARQYDRLFFSGIAAVILVTVFIGFARSYYLAGVFHARLPGLLIHIHGAVFTCWILLLIVQTSLVVAGRIAWHRRLGIAGFALACAMVIIGIQAATQVLDRPPALGQSPRGPRAFYIVPLSDMLVFSTLVYFGFRERKNPAAHKRLMLIATITVLDAAFVRWPLSWDWWTLRVAQMGCYPLLLLIIAYDLWSRGRIHAATILASSLLIISQQVRSPFGRSVPWQRFAATVQSLTR